MEATIIHPAEPPRAAPIRPISRNERALQTMSAHDKDVVFEDEAVHVETPEVVPEPEAVMEEEPVVEAPVAEEPAVEEPAMEEEPVAEEPVVEEEPIVAEEVVEPAQTHSKNDEPEVVEDPALTREEYESLFPLPPEAPRASTTYSLFSDPHRFSQENIYASPHILTGKLGGTAWLDANADGARGSATDPTLNALEEDTGVAGVRVSLVSCATDQLVGSSVTLPDPGRQSTAGASLKRTQFEEAGEYAFNVDLDVGPGRYYLAFKAPKDYRMMGNVLPLARNGDGADFDCVPRGGEGEGCLEEIQQEGDLDWGGYCARSVGCFEVGWKFTLEEDYADLSKAEDAREAKGTDTLIAVPSADFLDVGLAEELWPLGTYQFADAEVTLAFPSTVSEEALEGAAPEDFGTSDMKSGLEAALARFLVQGDGGGFSVQGVDVHAGEIVGSEDSSSPSSYRGLRGLQTEGEDPTSTKAKAKQVKYTLTTRGTYQPPPKLQLGSIVQESINADPQGLVKSLKDREGLPPVFEEVEGVEARHLKVEVIPKTGGAKTYQQKANETSNNEGTEEWAIYVSILLAFLILALAGVLLFRRIFVRRTRRVGLHDGAAAKKQRAKKTKTVMSEANDGIVVAPLGDEGDKKNDGGILRRLFGRQEHVADDQGRSLRAIPQERDEGGFFQRLAGRFHHREEIGNTATMEDEEGVDAYLQRGSGFAAPRDQPPPEPQDEAAEAEVGDSRRKRKKRRSRNPEGPARDPSGRDSFEVHGSTSTRGSRGSGRKRRSAAARLRESLTRGSRGVYESTSTRGSRGSRGHHLSGTSGTSGNSGGSGDSGASPNGGAEGSRRRSTRQSSSSSGAAHAEDREAEERRQRRKERRRRERERLAREG